MEETRNKTKMKKQKIQCEICDDTGYFTNPFDGQIKCSCKKQTKNKNIPLDALVIPPKNSFILGDCMDYLKLFPPNFFDLAIVDPPYGIDYTKRGDGSESKDGSNWINHKQKDWDVSPPAPEYFGELRRVSKNQVIWGGNYFDMPKTRCWLIWDKLQEFSGSDFEMAWTSFNKPSKTFRMSRVQAYAGRERIHPTQKPEELYRWVLKYLGRAGDLILDTHVGSASSLIACTELGFDYIGFEKDEEYYTMAKSRLGRAVRKYELFEAV